MKKSKFTEVQIIKILGEQNQGKSVADICREHGISQPTFYQCKSKYSGLEVHQLKKMKELEAELAQYKKIVAEQTLAITVLKDVIEKKL
jgi:putative transposase